ncbi:MAG: MFS transporter [Verrucomicrobia bacterium]|nr:MFS transporter [Verrucomicrobiota bacterium]
MRHSWERNAETDSRAPEPATRADPSPSPQSLHALSALNFLMADVRDGVGPFLAVYLREIQHWAPAQVGIAMSASNVTAAICQIPAGLFVDYTRYKRGLVSLACALVALGCVAMGTYPTLLAVVSAKALLGGASAFMPPAIAALTLGLVGHCRLPARVSRNETYNHSGNFTAALLAGVMGQYIGPRWIFSSSPFLRR